jgi:hypothetical protein
MANWLGCPTTACINPLCETGCIRLSAPITKEEMVEMFGEEMPREAVNLVWDSPGEMTVGEIRTELRRIARQRT